MAARINIQQLLGTLAAHAGGRLLVAVAGAPGSGKSTVAAQLESGLNARRAGCAAILPMDGFHYDDSLLSVLGRRQRKGAPDTFDVGGLHHTLLRLRDNAEKAIAVPVFDRDLEIARAGARLIRREVSVVIVEGNYLLLRQEPWSILRPLFGMTVMVDTDMETLRRRLTARWQAYDLPADEVARRVEENDLPNGALVLTHSVDADFRLLC